MAAGYGADADAVRASVLSPGSHGRRAAVPAVAQRPDRARRPRPRRAHRRRRARRRRLGGPVAAHPAAGAGSPRGTADRSGRPGGGGIAHACRQQSVVALPRPVRRRPRPGRRKPPGIMECVTPNRLRAGACAWLLTLQFFVVETIAQLRYTGPYSRMDDVISDLGASPSPAAQLMNASFVLQAALILAGALLLRPALRGTSGRVAPVLLELAAAGVLLVGVFPSDGHAALHATGAILHLLGGGLGLIALAYSLRPRSEAVGTTLALLGVIGTAMTLFFIAGVTQYLGDGGTE